MLSSMQLDFRFPSTRVVSGVDSLTKLPQLLDEFDCHYPLIVTDKGIAKAGILDRVTKVVTSTIKHWHVFDDVEESPSSYTVEQITARFHEHECDILVGLGGGSSIDAGKAAAMLAANGGEIRSYAGNDKFREMPRPFIAIPTTAGTGSEVASAAVISDHETKHKFGVRSHRMRPLLALLDPSLLATLPRTLAAVTAFDALDHNLSYFLSHVAMPLSEANNARAVELILHNLPTFVADRSNTEAASNMQFAALMGGIVFARPRVGVAHSMAHALDKCEGIPHGMAVAITVPKALRFNMPYCITQLARLARILGLTDRNWSPEKAAESVVIAVEELYKKVGIPEGLSKLGVSADSIPKLVEETFTQDHVKVNPRPVDFDGLTALFKECM